MAFAFCHPSIRRPLGSLSGISEIDYARGGKFQKLGRELAFDMGITIIRDPMPEELGGDWRSKIQYFNQGYAAGLLIEQNKLKYYDIAKYDFHFFKKYILTLPLYAWRGFSFSAYPFISLAISLSVFALLLTKYWPFALLCVSSQIFHIFFTHNIPRYHAIEIPVLISSLVFLILTFFRFYKKIVFYKV